MRWRKLVKKNTRWEERSMKCLREVKIEEIDIGGEVREIEEEEEAGLSMMDKIRILIRCYKVNKAWKRAK
ncbi:MAG: hypothetical protein QW052_06210 [Candidatus Nitrosocaldaceae archaeon]